MPHFAIWPPPIVYGMSAEQIADVSSQTAGAAPDRCFWCERVFVPEHKMLKQTKDHVYPLALGGREAPWNIVPCCAHCNLLKGSLLPDRWQAFTETHPNWWEKYSTKSAARRRVKKAASHAYFKALALAGMPFSQTVAKPAISLFQTPPSEPAHPNTALETEPQPAG